MSPLSLLAEVELLRQEPALAGRWHIQVKVLGYKHLAPTRKQRHAVIAYKFKSWIRAKVPKTLTALEGTVSLDNHTSKFRIRVDTSEYLKWQVPKEWLKQVEALILELEQE